MTFYRPTLRNRLAWLGFPCFVVLMFLTMACRVVFYVGIALACIGHVFDLDWVEFGLDMAVFSVVSGLTLIVLAFAVDWFFRLNAKIKVFGVRVRE